MAVPPISKFSRLIVVFASGAILLSALGALGAALASQPKPLWFLAAFELVILIASVFGILAGRGRFGEGPATVVGWLAVLTAVGSILGYIGANRELLGRDMRWLLMIRLGLSALTAAAAAWIVLERTWPTPKGALIKCLAASAALVVLATGAWKFRGQLQGSSEAVQTILALAGFAAGTAILAAAVQWGASAFTAKRS